MTLRMSRGTGRCCWKPAGCTNEDGCRLLEHPAKRAAAGVAQAWLDEQPDLRPSTGSQETHAQVPPEAK